MQRRKIDYCLYAFWLGFVLSDCCFVFATLIVDKTDYWSFADDFFTCAIIQSSVIVTTFFINAVLIPLIQKIALAIDKRLNPEKYKALAEMHREIDKMMTELDEEIEKVIKEKNDGQ